jgi:hypothetical protein
MILPEPPEPKYWKALVPALLVAIPVALFFHAVIRGSPLWLWLGLGIVFAMAGAYSMHRKARYDAASQWEMNFSRIDRATYIPPNVRIRDK